MIKTIKIQYEDNLINSVSENFNYLIEVQTKYHNEIINKKYHEILGLIKNTGYVYNNQKFPYKYYKNSGYDNIFIKLDIINSPRIKNRKYLNLQHLRFNTDTNEECLSFFDENLECNYYNISYKKGVEEYTYKNNTVLDTLEFYKILIGHTKDFNNLISTIKMKDFLKESSKNE